jgi:hypothetical protein
MMTGKTGVQGIIGSDETDKEIMAELEQMQSWTATELAAYAILHYGRRGECRETEGRPAAVRRRAHDLIVRHGGQREGDRRGNPYALPTPEAKKLVPPMRTAFGIRVTEEPLAAIGRDYESSLENRDPWEEEKEYEHFCQDNSSCIPSPTPWYHDELLVVEYLLQVLIAGQCGGRIVNLKALRGDLEAFFDLITLDPPLLTVDDLDRMGKLHDKLLHYRKYLADPDGMRFEIGKPGEPKEDGAYTKAFLDSIDDIKDRLL